MRLAKYLAHAGIASRRAAEELIREGRVSVGATTVTDPARDVSDADEISFDGRPVSGSERRIVIALHKPAGVVSTASDTHGRRTVVALVDMPELRLYPVGRLDVDTTGLILLTNDGELAHALTHPSFEVPRTYIALVEGGVVAERDLRALREGIELEDGMSAPARVRQLSPGRLRITIHEGRKRQVRRMCKAIGHPVRQLQRTHFGPLALEGLAVGKSRRLTPAEVQRLRDAGG